MLIDRSALLLMHPDLQHLIQLQELDSTAERLRRRIADIPAAQAALDARLAELTAAVAAVKERIATSQATRRDIEKDLAAVQTRLSKYKGQLMEVKTNKEYQAMQNEITAAEEVVRGQEDRMLEQMEEAETLAAELKAAEAALKAEQAKIAAGADRDRRPNAATLEQELEKTRERAALAAQRVDAGAGALRARRPSTARAWRCPRRATACARQCHVRLRPQMFNEVRRNDELHQCESCSRILYFVPVSTPDAAPSA